MLSGRIRFRTEHLAIAGSLALLVAAVLVLGRGPAGADRDPLGLSTGSCRFATPGGTKALYVLLRDLDYSVTRHARRIELLPRGVSLLLLLAPSRPPDADAVAWAKGWVAEGGTLLWAPRGRGVLPAEADAEARPFNRIDGPSTEADALPAAFGLKRVPCGAAGVSRVTATLEPFGGGRYGLACEGEDRLAAVSASSPARPLAADDRGWIAAVVPSGKGRFVALADLRLVSNAGLAAADHAAFAVHLVAGAAGGGRIVFDEYHHGDRGGQSALAVVWDSPLGPALLLGLAAVFSAVMARGRRLGPPLDRHTERRRRPAEYLDACARLCRSLRAGPPVMAMILAEIEQFLRRQTGASTPEAIEAVAVKAGLPADRLPRALARARALAGASHADETELVACARELERLRSALRVAAGRGQTPGPVVSRGARRRA